MEDDSDIEDETKATPESLLPYDLWTEAALRAVVTRALDHAAKYGLPGAHHFFITFRTDQPGVEMPASLRARYPREITIVLQHQFWDLTLDTARELFSVGLSFGGVPSRVTVPFAAITAFADPAVQFGLQFQVADPPPVASEESAEPPPAAEDVAETPQIVQLSAFRKRTKEAKE
jgi:hypothetical protein